MHDQSDASLLRSYASQGAETAFAEIVARHTDLVYSAALRQVHSSDLARKARTVSATLNPEASLVGWLYRGTRFAARDLNRGEIRRTQRERLAMEQLHSTSEPPTDWEQLRPVLDEAMAELDDTERDALLLRYFKNHDLRTVGAALGISDDAAQKRVSRAVERLREFFTKRGVAVGAGGLAVVISANAVQAAPMGLALSISTAATLTGIPLATNIATQTAMNWINLKSTTAILTAALVAGSGTYLVKRRETNVLAQELQAVKAEKVAMTSARDNALASVASDNAELERLRQSQNDLLRLRAEVSALRKQSGELNQLREEKRQTQAALQNAPAVKPVDPAEDDLERQLGIAKMKDARLLVMGLMMFANDNQDQFPADLSQTTNYLKSAERQSEYQLTDTNIFELVLRGPLKGVASPATTLAVREREASFVKGKWIKAYGFADGHSEIKTEPAEGFAAWEKAHMIPAPPPQQ